MTGWNLPPGVTSRMIEEAQGDADFCEVCGKSLDACRCPTCPECGEVGRQACYDEGHFPEAA